MRKRALALFILASFLIGIGCSQESDYERYWKNISSHLSDEVKLREIHREISQDLSKKPDDHKLLEIRAQLSAILGDENAYNTDLYKLAELLPDHT